MKATIKSSYSGVYWANLIRREIVGNATPVR